MGWPTPWRYSELKHVLACDPFLRSNQRCRTSGQRQLFKVAPLSLPSPGNKETWTHEWRPDLTISQTPRSHVPPSLARPPQTPSFEFRGLSPPAIPLEVPGAGHRGNDPGKKTISLCGFNGNSMESQEVKAQGPNQIAIRGAVC